MHPWRIPTFLLLTFTCLAGFAQTDTVNIKEVVIQSGKLSSYALDATRVIQIISREQIQNLPAQNLNDLLAYAINADVRKRGADEVQADVSIRGGSLEQTLVLLNGVRVNGPQTGHHNLDLPVELSQVERIEILQGSGARTYGANAFCGIINIITNVPNKNYIKLSAATGMYHQYSGVVSAGLATNKTSHFLSLSAKSCSGYTKNTDYTVLKGFYSGSYLAKFGTFSLQAGYADKAFGANSFYSAKYPDQFEHTKTGFSSLQFNSSGSVKVTPQIYWRRHHDRFELFRENAPTWYKTHNYHLTDVVGSMANVQFNTIAGKTLIKAEYFFEKIISNVLGTPLADTLHDVMDKTGYFTKIGKRNNISLSAEQAYSTSKFTIALGFLVNYNDAFQFNYCPGMDAAYSFKPWAKWYISANKSFRLPTFTDLYYHGPTNQGNANLVPEIAYTVETGLKFSFKGVYAHISGFYRYGKNLIDWVKPPDSLVWQSANVTKLQTLGIESALTVNFAEYKCKHNPITSIQVAYAYLTSTKNSGDYVSYYLMDYLKHKLTLGVNARIYKKIGMNVAFSYNNRNGTYTNFADGRETNYKEFTTFDAKVFWRPTHFDIYVNCNNLFDTHYYDYGNIEMPGRWISGGISYQFNFSKKQPAK
ncbi:MAG: TonB-dependent receptor [Bacteroidota bacterium]